jgi:hypothetical protein
MSNGTRPSLSSTDKCAVCFSARSLLTYNFQNSCFARTQYGLFFAE